jgi:hypothetical protein
MRAESVGVSVVVRAFVRPTPARYDERPEGMSRGWRSLVLRLGGTRRLTGRENAREIAAQSSVYFQTCSPSGVRRRSSRGTAFATGFNES